MTATALSLTPEVRRRLRRCLTHIAEMESEREGYGPGYQFPIERTRVSLLNAIGMLLAAKQVWTDGVDPSLSLGGEMPGGIVFGMIACEKVPPDNAVPNFVEFIHPEIEWTFHS